MKTMKKIAALGMMLLLAATTTFAADAGGIKNPPIAAVIRHMVVLPIHNDMLFCGTYVIEIRNENGQLVAPPKLFVPGIRQYLFFERVFTGEAVRSANLRQVSNTDPWQCESLLYSEPSVIKGMFEAGKTYRYMLDPKVISNVKD